MIVSKMRYLHVELQSAVFSMVYMTHELFTLEKKLFLKSVQMQELCGSIARFTLSTLSVQKTLN